MTRVGIADDQPLIRAGLLSLLEHAAGMDCVGEAADGLEAVDLARRAGPDVMVMDVRMPRLDGIEATRRIVADPVCATVKVLILTTFDIDEHVYAALRAGASGFLLKDAAPEDLLTAISVVATGDALIHPAITRRLIAEFVRRPAVADRGAIKGVERLTDRERQILTMVARGLSNAEIAEAELLSYATVKTHVSRILTKLGMRDRAQLVVLAYESGLVTPGSR
ncbi:MAG TPA: response regulator transcription factor [Acidimicrobiia bacterium]|nr:response regulator transcription factor [Acidimicrobiia bacterium]